MQLFFSTAHSSTPRCIFHICVFLSSSTTSLSSLFVLVCYLEIQLFIPLIQLHPASGPFVFYLSPTSFFFTGSCVDIFPNIGQFMEMSCQLLSGTPGGVEGELLLFSLAVSAFFSSLCAREKAAVLYIFSCQYYEKETTCK